MSWSTSSQTKVTTTSDCVLKVGLIWQQWWWCMGESLFYLSSWFPLYNAPDKIVGILLDRSWSCDAVKITILGVKIWIGRVIEFEAGGEQSKMTDSELVAMDLSWGFSVCTDFLTVYWMNIASFHFRRLRLTREELSSHSGSSNEYDVAEILLWRHTRERAQVMMLHFPAIHISCYLQTSYSLQGLIKRSSMW